jgi:hypothetical protein
MQNKLNNSKETDITAALVVVFVLMLAILIAKVANDFTKQTTSTSSKASEVKDDVKYDPKFVFEKNWFGKTILVDKNNECASQCTGMYVADNTSYGNYVCKNKKRCLPIEGEKNVKSLFDFAGGVGPEHTFCEDQTKSKGAVCYTNWGVNMKGIVIGNYKLFSTSSKLDPTKTPYLRKVAFEPNMYNIECPIYSMPLGNVGTVIQSVNKQATLENIKAGLCYTLKVQPTPTAPLKK